MADDIKIVVDVDDSDVLQTIKNHEILEKRVKELNREYARLDKALNSGKISAQTYARAIGQVDKQVESLHATMRLGGKAVADLATGMNHSGKAARRNEVAFQQAGYQIQDFIVQVQGGTNPLIAFSQQASQLAGFFAGPWGAMIGLGIAALSSLAMAFLATSEDVKHLEKNLGKIEDALDDFQSKVEDAQETVSSFAYAMAQVQKVQIEAAWASLGESTAGAFEASFMAKIGAFLGANLWTGFETWGDISGRLAGENFASAFGEGAKGVLDQELLDQIGKAVEDKNVEILDSTIESLSAFEDMTTTGAKFLEYLINIRDEANGFTKEVKDAASEIEAAHKDASKLADLDLALGIGEAAKVAELLAERMGIALEAAYSLINAATQETSGPIRGGRGRTQPDASDIFMMGIGGEYFPYKTKKSSGGGGGRGETQEEFLAKLQREIELKKSQIGLFGEERKIMSEVARLKEQVIKKDYDISEKKLEQIVREEQALERRLKREEDLYNTIYSSIENTMMDLVTGAQSVEDAFKQMLFNIIQEIYKQQVAKPVADLGSQIFSNILGGLTGGGAPTTSLRPKIRPSAKGNMFSGGYQVEAFASGGVVNGPTYFPMKGNSTGLMGEAGPEAIMPLKRASNGDLGVQVAAQQPTEIVVTLSPELVGNILSQAEGQSVQVVNKAAGGIIRASVSAVTSERRKGGTMKAAFG